MNKKVENLLNGINNIFLTHIVDKIFAKVFV